MGSNLIRSPERFINRVFNAMDLGAVLIPGVGVFVGYLAASPSISVLRALQGLGPWDILVYLFASFAIGTVSIGVGIAIETALNIVLTGPDSMIETAADVKDDVEKHLNKQYSLLDIDTTKFVKLWIIPDGREFISSEQKVILANYLKKYLGLEIPSIDEVDKHSWYSFRHQMYNVLCARRISDRVDYHKSTQLLWRGIAGTSALLFIFTPWMFHFQPIMYKILFIDGVLFSYLIVKLLRRRHTLEIILQFIQSSIEKEKIEKFLATRAKKDVAVHDLLLNSPAFIESISDSITGEIGRKVSTRQTGRHLGDRLYFMQVEPNDEADKKQAKGFEPAEDPESPDNQPSPS